MNEQKKKKRKKERNARLCLKKYEQIFRMIYLFQRV